MTVKLGKSVSFPAVKNQTLVENCT